MDREIRMDHIGNRLVFVTRKADRDYWASVHGPLATRSNIERGDRFVVRETAKYLAQEARVIDAGCGIGATVFGLREAGFDAYGIDYDEMTVAKIKDLFPDLNVQVADIHAMPFDDGFFDGVWSLGVIEHFYHGYGRILDETRRVLRPGGYLFLTVPSISPIKKLKMRLGRYREMSDGEVDDFFQFSFHAGDTITEVTNGGFELVKCFGRSSSLGFYEDAPALARLFLLDPDNRSVLPRIIWRAADIILKPLSFHMMYFLFRKRTA